MHIKETIATYTLGKPKTKKNIQFSFQELGVQMQEWFPAHERNFMWSLFYKYSEPMIREAWRRIQTTDIHSTRYLVGILKKL